MPCWPFSRPPPSLSLSTVKEMGCILGPTLGRKLCGLLSWVGPFAYRHVPHRDITRCWCLFVGLHSSWEQKEKKNPSTFSSTLLSLSYCSTVTLFLLSLYTLYYSSIMHAMRVRGGKRNHYPGPGRPERVACFRQPIARSGTEHACFSLLLLKRKKGKIYKLPTSLSYISSSPPASASICF